ncbi:hypothetical protein L7F22_045051 [Adiantum nelumboides]|nr:hypothetical protein [Adiantum nelumboides]
MARCLESQVPIQTAAYWIACQQHRVHKSNAARSTRRSLTHTLLLGTSLHLASTAVEPALAADGKSKYFTNLEEAREEGERRREQKERAEGPIVTLPSGVKFRELKQGSGETVSIGQSCSVSYTIYKLNGLYLDSLGYGKEGKDDIGDTITIQYGGANDETPMLVNYLITKLHQAMANAALQGKVQQ